MALTADSTALTTIKPDDFKASLGDDKVKKLIDDSKAYGDALSRNGKDHSLRSDSERS